MNITIDKSPSISLTQINFVLLLSKNKLSLGGFTFSLYIHSIIVSDKESNRESHNSSIVLNDINQRKRCGAR